VKRFLLAAALALILHGLFFGLGPNLLSTPTPATPRPLTVTFAPRVEKESGPGPELEHPVPSPDRVELGPEKDKEKPVVEQNPLEEIPKPPKEAVPPRKEAPSKPRQEVEREVRAARKEVVKSPQKRPPPEKKQRPPEPPPAKAHPQPKEKPRLETTPEPAADGTGVTAGVPMEGGAAERKGPQPNVPHISAPVTAETGEKTASLPSTRKMTKATPAYRENPRPEYPRIAKRRGYEGTVVLEVLVNSGGKVDELRILESSGYGILDRSALKSVRDWVFEPGSVGDRKVAMWVRVPVRFELKQR
jgi:periplasmic protein TonB